jgi:hypothetical protein
MVRRYSNWRILISDHLSTLTVIAIMLPLAAWVFASFIYRIQSRAVWDYGPGWLAMAVQRLLRGSPLYGDFLHPPYAGLVYNPLSVLVAAWLTPLFRPDPLAPLEAGRLLVVCSTAGVCMLVFLLARREGGGWAGSLIVVLCLLVSPLFATMGFEFRADVPALALELLGLYLFETKIPWAAVACFTLAFFTKQDYIAGIGGVLLYLLLNQRRRPMLLIGFGWLISVATLTAAAQVVWPYYLANVYFALVPIYVFRAGLSMDAHVLFKFFAIFALAAAFLIRKGPKASPAACFLLVAAVTETSASLRWGSNVYYFLPAIAAAAIIAAPQLNDLLNLIESAALPLRALCGLAIAWAASIAWVYSLHEGLWSGALPRHLSRTEVSIGPWDPRSLEELRAAKGLVFSDLPELALIDPFASFFATDPQLLCAMHQRNLFDDGQLLSMVSNHQFAIFALDNTKLDREWQGQPFFWPELQRTIEANYEAVPNIGPPYLMVPKGPRIDPAPAHFPQ